MKARAFFIVALLIVAAATLLSGDASAASEENCRVATIQYDNQRIGVWCFDEPAIHWIHGSAFGSKCAPLVSMDTIKIWASLLQSSLLSGRPVDLYYIDNTKCTAGQTTRVVEMIRLQNR